MCQLCCFPLHKEVTKESYRMDSVTCAKPGCRIGPGKMFYCFHTLGAADKVKNV